VVVVVVVVVVMLVKVIVVAVVVVMVVVFVTAAAVVVLVEVGCGGFMRNSRTHVIDFLPCNFVTIRTLHVCGFMLCRLMWYKRNAHWPLA
jgi:hypothetical protein